MQVRLNFFFMFIQTVILSLLVLAQSVHINVNILICGVSLVLFLCWLVDSCAALAILISLLPFSIGLDKINIGPATLDIVSLNVAVIFMFSLPKIVRNYKTILSNYFFILLMSAFAVFSLFNSPNLLEGGRIAFMSVFVPIAIMLLIFINIIDELDFRLIISLYVLSAFVFSFGGICQFVLTQSRLEFFNVPTISTATFLFTALMLQIYILGCEGVFKKIVFLTILLAFVLTMPRVYLLLFVTALLTKKYIVKFGFIKLFVCLFLLALALTLTVSKLSTSSKVVEHTDKETSKSIARFYSSEHLYASFLGRGPGWVEGLSNFASSPVFGNGFEQGEILAARHNLIVEWLERQGGVGFLLYFVFFYSLFKRSSKHVYDNKIYSCSLIIVVILANGVTNGVSLGLIPSTLFTIVGLLSSSLLLIKSKV